MAYTNKEYFLARKNEDDLNALTASSDTNLDTAIEDADNLIDTYLKDVVTTLPIAEPPKIIKRCSYDIALFYLYDRAAYVDVPVLAEKKYKDALSFLKDIRDGVMTLEGLPDAEDVSADNSVLYGAAVSNFNDSTF
jgi:phage gp36-like protein